MEKTPIDLNECCGEELEWRYLKDKVDHSTQKALCPTCETVYARRDKGSVMYVNKDSGYYCGSCNSKILSTRVMHAINVPLPPCAPRGFEEKVAYCPNCEEKPSFIGSEVNQEFLDKLIEKSG